MQSDRIGDRQVLIGKPSQKLRGTLEFRAAHGGDPQRRHVLDHRQELQRAGAIVAAKEPGVAFRDHQRRRQQRRRLREQAVKRRVMRIGAVDERDQRRCVDVGAGLFGHRRRSTRT